MTSQLYVSDLQSTVERAAPALLLVSEQDSTRPRAPGKWSPREEIGHLIDSASINQQRFVRVQFQDDLVFAGYRQDDWVRVQRYRDAPWADLVTLWRALNLHLARVMAAVPESVRTRAHRRHNLNEIAFRAVAAEEPATLDYFMADYVDHMKHHLRQLLGADWDTKASRRAGPGASAR